ncbi:sirohydrochlorin chelatase [Nitrosococcus halophilus]|uniref:sirohydrochlorin chelatase n=1 Tax=Nitrosococcus halophilus TaxID=133539 RepID=UPI00031B770C|nr:hypothetical protein [Nitrosococcus halophilus]
MARLAEQLNEKFPTEVAFGKAMDDHPLVSEILLERALAMGTSPEKTTVILIAHGPNTEEENRRWLEDLATHAHYLHRQGRFHEVRYLTHRTDAPEAIRARAREAFRTAAQEASYHGKAVVIPVLLSAGGIEGAIRNDLKGLTFHFGQPPLPHPNVQRWVEAQYYQLTGQSF